MILMVALGAVAQGLAAGWLAVLLAGAGPRRSPWTQPTLAGAALCLGCEALAFAGREALVLLLSAAALGLALHLGWRRWLAERSGVLPERSLATTVPPPERSVAD